MSPEEHAAEAVALAERVAGDGGSLTDADSVVFALIGLTHAVLSLRPAPVEEPPVVEGTPARMGAVVRARVDGIRRMLARLPESDDDTFPWVADSGMCFADEDLTDVEVLYPGVPS